MFIRGIEFVIVRHGRVVVGPVAVIVVIDERILETENVAMFETAINVKFKVAH